MIIKKTKYSYGCLVVLICGILFATTSVTNAASSEVPATLMVPASNIDEVVEMNPVKTGDSFLLWPWLLVCIAAFCIGFIALMKKRKKDN